MEVERMETEEMEEEGELKDSDDEDGLRPEPRRSKFSFEDGEQTEKRTIRFDVDVDVDPDDDFDALHASLGIVTEEDRRHARFDTIRVRGTGRMTTDDVFQYFSGLPPMFLEWIDDDSCNVVWKDDISAAKAMVLHSKPAPGGAPGWRSGAPHPKAEAPLLRFGNRSDRKPGEDEKPRLYSKKYGDAAEGAAPLGKVSEAMRTRLREARADVPRPKNPWGDLCRSWGIGDSQEFCARAEPPPDAAGPPRRSIRDRIGRVPDDGRDAPPRTVDLRTRLGKRRAADRAPSDEEDASEDDEWKTRSKAPRMRMHADDEEKRAPRPRPARDPSDNENPADGPENVPDMRERLGNGARPSALRSRLGRRKSSDSESRESDDSESTPKKHTVSSTIWCRLGVPKNSLRPDVHSDDGLTYSDPDVDDDEDEDDDLRDHLAKKSYSQRSPLRIEIDNEHYSDS